MPPKEGAVERHIVENVTLTPANTWIDFNFPEWVESWMMQARTDVSVDWRFGGRSTRLLTLKAGYVHVEDTSPRKVWLRSATAGVVVELEIWGRR